MRISTSIKSAKVEAILLLLLFMPCLLWAQHTASIKGTVLTTDNKPLSYASVLLKDTRFGTRVTDNGAFTVEAPTGSYTLIVTYAGYTVYTTELSVKSGETVDLGTIAVQSNYNQLREVIVEDIQKNKFARKETEDVARMPLANLENAQAYSVVPKELMVELGATDYNSALQQVAGTVTSNGVNDSGNQTYMRGFNVYSTFRNGLPSNPRTASEIYNLERVEVIKGPSATLFGSSNGSVNTYGGIINNVTKRPFESFRGEVSYTTGSWAMNRITADVNTPLNADHTALARFNIMGTTQNGFQDAGRQKAMGFATSLLFKASERTTVRFDADIYVPEKTLLAYVRNTNLLSYGSMDKVSLPYDRALLSDDITTPRSNMNVAAELEHKISDNWTSKTIYQFNQSGDKNSIFFVPTFMTDSTIARRYRIFDQFINTYNSLQQNFTGDYTIGQVNNKLVAGIDYSYTSTTNQSMYPIFITYDVVNINNAAWKTISRADIDKSRAASSVGDSYDKSSAGALSAYFSNVTNLGDRLFVMVSARLNRFMQHNTYSQVPATATAAATVTDAGAYNQTNISPKFGIVFQPIKDQLSVFANYQNSFANVAASLGVQNESETEATMMNWKPEQANQFEVGVKGELLDDRINVTASYYDIEVSNIIRTLDTQLSIQDGTVRSKGFEFDLIANPLSGWNIIFGYGYNDNEYVKSSSALEGKRMTWTPRNVANLWSSYKFLDGSIKGFGVGAGLKYVDRVYLDVNKVFSVPSYTVFNATAFYDQPKYRVGLKLNNLGDIHYWDFYGKAQKPLEILGTLSFKF